MRRLLAPAVLALAACGGGGADPPRAGDPAGHAVVAVVDGDTLDVRVGAATERVRIVGINAPERGECFADEATELLADLVEGEDVRLVRDESDRDRFGRLLRYVEVEGGDVGEALVRAGAAVVRVSEPDTARESALRTAQQAARSAATGLWSSDACGRPATARPVVRITALRLDADGDDAANLDDEWVEVANEGATDADLGGWTVRDESASHRFTFPDGYRLAAGARVRIRSGCGPDTSTDLHWCVTGSAVWNNDGDTAFLLDASGNVVDDLHDPGR